MGCGKMNKTRDFLVENRPALCTGSDQKKNQHEALNSCAADFSSFLCNSGSFAKVIFYFTFKFTIKVQYKCVSEVTVTFTNIYYKYLNNSVFKSNMILSIFLYCREM